jgi:hypothetical protein
MKPKKKKIYIYIQDEENEEKECDNKDNVPPQIHYLLRLRILIQVFHYF